MIVGIDLGTTYSAIAYIDKDGNPRIITNSEGGRTTPSAVMFEDDGSIIVGELAKSNAIVDDCNVVEFIKNEMGNPNYRYRTNKGDEYTPEEISAFILKKLKNDGESFLDTEITEAVITVPAYFNDAQRKSTQDAGSLAGLDVIKIINEPTAAAIAYGMENKLEDSNILVYDLGGGTFDATIVHYNKDNITIKATDGIRRLGGHFFDQEIVRFAAEQFMKKHNIALYDDQYIDVLQELNKRAEECKIHLNVRSETYIPISCDGIRDRIKITKEQYEKLINNLYERTERIVINTLRDAELSWKDIDKILLVGGSSRTNYVRERLKKLSGMEPSSEINPDEAVAIGAAIQASIIKKSNEIIIKEEVKIIDVCSHGIGIITIDALTQKQINSVIIDRNTQLPAKASRRFFTSEEDQEIIQLEVTEGESEDIEDVNIIGNFEIEVPRGLKKDSEVEIEALIDESQIVHIYTRIPSKTDFFKEVQINRSRNLSAQQIIKKKDLISRVSVNKSKNNTETIKEETKKEEIVLPPEIEKEFEGLIGMESVKIQILKFINIIKLNEKRGLPSVAANNTSQGYHFMLLGNPGTGKTSVARIIAKILKILSIRTNDVFIEVDKSGLVGQYIGQTEEKVTGIIAQSQGGSLFIDEAYTLYDKDNPKDFGRDALNVIMKSMEDYRDSFTVILAGYKKQMYEMLEANVGLKSRINYIIEIPDYTDDELLKIADSVAEEKALIITDSGKKAIKERINQERIDDKFGNARFIRNLINDAYSNLANRLASAKHSYEDMFKLEAIDFGINLERTPEEEIEQALKELNELVGLDEVKTEVQSIVNTMKVMREMSNMGLKTGNIGFGTLHMAFLGGPGTGKTTVARIIGRIYKALGILKRGDVFIECSRKDLVGEYQGQTGPKTQSKINEAMGGILFIDEAYDMYHGENDSFGNEAITTLIAEMENNRDKLMVILAGYDDDINNLFDANAGFRSRINNTIHFQDYTLDQLVDIFVNLVKKEGLYMDKGTVDKARELILNKSKKKDFGNARGIRNVLQSISRNKNNRIANEMSPVYNLKKEDYLIIKPIDIF